MNLGSDDTEKPENHHEVGVEISHAPTSRTESSNRHHNQLQYGYAYGNHTQREKPLREYLSTVLHYKFVILFCIAVGIYIGHVLHKRQPIVYQTSSMINVGSYLAPTDGPTAEVIKFETSRTEYLENLIPLLTSYAIAKISLTKEPDVREAFDPNFKNTAKIEGSEDPKNLESVVTDDIPISVLDAYLSSISTFHDKNTTLFSITGTSGNPQLAAKIANAHAEAFMETVRKQRFVWATTNVEFLTKRTDDLRRKATQAEKNMLEFARAHNINLATRTRQVDMNANRIENMVSQIGEASLDKVLNEHQFRALRQSLSSDGISVTDKSFSLLPQLRQLESQSAKMKRLGYGPNITESIDTQIRDLKQILKQSTSQELREAQAKKTAADAKEKFLKSELDEIKKRQDSRAEEEIQFAALEKEAKIYREDLAKLETRLEEALINAESDQKTVSMVDPAVAPINPIMSHHVSTLLSGGLLGVLLGVGLAFLLDNQRGAIRSSSDLQAIIESPILGIIPTFSRELIKQLKPLYIGDGIEILESEIDLPDPLNSFSRTFAELVETKHGDSQALKIQAATRLAITAKPHSKESEAFRNVRAALKFSNRGKNPRKILLTSGQKGDGKTTITVNLAASFAQTSSRTLLIDADLRMPTVHSYFNYERSQRGLGDYLTKPGRLSDYILDTEIEYLSLIVAGNPVQNPAELLGTRKMLELLEQAYEEYDYIFIDTPPVGEIADALLLCPHCDGVVLVARSNATPGSVLELASSRLDQVRARILGSILNGVSALDGFAEGYYGYYYSKK